MHRGKTQLAAHLIRLLVVINKVSLHSRLRGKYCCHPCVTAGGSEAGAGEVSCLKCQNQDLNPDLSYDKVLLLTTVHSNCLPT